MLTKRRKNDTNDIEKELRDNLVQEIRSIKIGDMVMERLKPIDDVSYIRFASVYRHFENIDEFIQEVKKVGGLG